MLKPKRAIVSGLVAGACVVVLMSLIAPLLGVDADLCVPIGAALGLESWAATTGCIAQLLLGAGAGIAYALIFELVTRRATWWLGALIGIGHACVAGLGVGFLFVYRAPVEGVSVPGGFMLFRGAWAAVVLVVAHVLFGVMVGAFYGPTLHRVPVAEVAWRDI